MIAVLGRDRLAFDWLWLAKKATDEEKAAVDKLRDRATKFFDIPDSAQVERNRYGELRKAPKLVKHIFTNVAPRFKDRAGGYTRIVRLGKHRIGDGSELALIQFVGARKAPRSAAVPAPAGARRIVARPTRPRSVRKPRPRPEPIFGRPLPILPRPATRPLAGLFFAHFCRFSDSVWPQPRFDATV